MAGAGRIERRTAAHAAPAGACRPVAAGVAGPYCPGALLLSRGRWGVDGRHPQHGRESGACQAGGRGRLVAGGSRGPRMPGGGGVGRSGVRGWGGKDLPRPRDVAAGGRMEMPGGGGSDRRHPAGCRAVACGTRINRGEKEGYDSPAVPRPRPGAAAGPRPLCDRPHPRHFGTTLPAASAGLQPGSSHFPCRRRPILPSVGVPCRQSLRKS